MEITPSLFKFNMEHYKSSENQKRTIELEYYTTTLFGLCAEQVTSDLDLGLGFLAGKANSIV